MGHISAAQLERALTFAGELADVQEFDQMSERVAQLLRELIACEHSGHNVIDLGIGEATVVADPPDAVFSGGPELLSRFAEQNPLIVQAKHGNLNALRLSDYISSADLHRTDLYNHVYKVVGLEYQMVLQFPPLFDGLSASQRLIGISLARKTKDFSDSDQLLLEVIRPILASTLQRLHHAALIRAIVDTARDGEVLILFDADHVVAWATPEAQERLGVSPGSLLPAALRVCLHEGPREWRRASDHAPTVTLAGQAVRVRFVANAYPGLDALYVVRVGKANQADSMRQLGITARQADVLVLLTQGNTTSEIADRLAISRRTVESHLASVYRKLGVQNRGQAILAALDLDAP